MGPKLRTTLPTAYSMGWPKMAGWAGLPSGREVPRHTREGENLRGKEGCLRSGTARLDTAPPAPPPHAPDSDHEVALPLNLTGTNGKGDLSPSVGEAPGISGRTSSLFPSLTNSGNRIMEAKGPCSRREGHSPSAFHSQTGCGKRCPSPPPKEGAGQLARVAS